MQAFKRSENPFGINLELPPLPSVTMSVMADPMDNNLGEKLITKTFFSFGDPGYLSIKERKVILSQTPDGEYESKVI